MLSEEIKRMQKLAGIINENDETNELFNLFNKKKTPESPEEQAPEETQEEKNKKRIAELEREIISTITSSENNKYDYNHDIDGSGRDQALDNARRYKSVLTKELKDLLSLDPFLTTLDKKVNINKYTTALLSFVIHVLGADGDKSVKTKQDLISFLK